MKNNKKNLILQAACAAFTESGYEKSSIESISRRAGVAHKNSFMNTNASVMKLFHLESCAATAVCYATG